MPGEEDFVTEDAGISVLENTHLSSPASWRAVRIRRHSAIRLSDLSVSLNSLPVLVSNDNRIKRNKSHGARKIRTHQPELRPGCWIYIRKEKYTFYSRQWQNKKNRVPLRQYSQNPPRGGASEGTEPLFGCDFSAIRTQDLCLRVLALATWQDFHSYLDLFDCCKHPTRPCQFGA